MQIDPTVGTWRTGLNVVALVLNAANVVYAVVFLMWPYFGAHRGGGSLARWELTATLVESGFLLGLVALIVALVGRAGRLRTWMAILAIFVAMFWYASLIGVTDIAVVERSRQEAAGRK